MDTSSTPVDPADMDEYQLRDLYESTEIDRFLHIFSTYVTEVKATNVQGDIPNPFSSDTQTESPTKAEGTFHGDTEQTLSSYIAKHYIIPLLPLQQHELAPFTLSRVRLTLNRMYIVTQLYWPYTKSIAALAQWIEFGTSFVSCVGFWVLWWFNCLLPTCILLLLLGLLRRGLLPYPSLDDLREHHNRIVQADKFSDQVSGKISPSSTLDIKEIWRLYRLAHSDWRQRLKSPNSVIDPPITDPQDSNHSLNQEGIEKSLESHDSTILDDPEQSKETSELRRQLLHVFTEIADFHERLRNIFIWRNPKASRRYSMGLFLLFLTTTLVPTQYLAKALWFSFGFAFWHITPVLCALSPGDRLRIPPPFVDVPTDAEYAMELISDRVTSGQDIQPPFYTEKRGESTDHKSEETATKATGKFMALGKHIGNEGLRAAIEVMKSPTLASRPIISGAIAMIQPPFISDVHTFMGQRGSSPGLITLTKDHLVFSHLMSSQPKVEIDLATITGVRKNGVLKGLQVTLQDPASHAESEEKFLWVSNRDELFARLLAAQQSGDESILLSLVLVEFSAAFSLFKMFFTQELLARRDSGFGLLWLAATLGSKSNFKKLPKKSVLSADIAQLCDLISKPMEPLALRLSSNLMFGVVRVYKVKQEILLTDVSNCVTALKKVVYEMNTKAVDAQLQMAQTSVRPSAVTIVPNSRAAHVVDYDAFVTDWDEYLNILDDKHAPRNVANDDDGEEFDPTQATKKKQKAKSKGSQGPLEAARQEAHTLTEHHEHLLSATFDLSYVGDCSRSLPGLGRSSSQTEGAFDFNENPFNLSDGLDIGGEGFMLGDELARELGWGSPAKSVARPVEEEPLQMDFSDGIDTGLNFEFDPENDHVGGDGAALTATPKSARRVFRTPRSTTRNANKENLYSRNTPGFQHGSVLSKRRPSPANSFGRLFLSQDDHLRVTPLQDITEERENGQIPAPDPKNTKKRARLLLDARTELTDDELKVARAQYLEFQRDLKRDMVKKKHERDGVKLIEDLMWGVPIEIQDPSLIDFWQTNFKVQLEARSGTFTIHQDDPPAKRRRRLSPVLEDEEQPEPEVHGDFGGFEHDLPGDMGMMMDMDEGPRGDFFEEGNPFARDNAHRGSSEEPGQGRRASRPSSVFDGGNIGLELEGQQKGLNSGSQRSSLFPWDNAGPSSSSANGPQLGGDENISFDHVEIRLRGSSRSRKSSVAPSQSGVGAGHGFSPIVHGTPARISADYEFYVAEAGPLVVPEETQDQETQKSEVHLATLERNSFNFLEYAKMQYRSLQAGGRLTFDMVVPQATSTRHVAASAFYHCLVLATKDLIRLEQPQPYETVVIDILNVL